MCYVILDTDLNVYQRIPVIRIGLGNPGIMQEVVSLMILMAHPLSVMMIHCTQGTGDSTKNGS